MRFFLLAFCIVSCPPAISRADAMKAAADTLRPGTVRVVPNPWCASRDSQHFAGETRDTNIDVAKGWSRVVFANLPSKATIRIYTVDGDLIRTIPHPMKEGGATRWDLITDTDQYAVSGIYIFVVESDVGTDVGKIIIIR